MNKVVQIHGYDLAVKEYRAVRVVTFKDIDEMHQRPEGTAGRNFRENRQHFVEGEDYFEVNQPDEIRRLGFERPQGGLPEKVILITESGYLMLVKSFTDDLAWQVQRQLVNNYFRNKQDVSWLVERELNKRIRVGLTDVIRDKGLNNQMHGYAFKNYTDLAYKAVLGMAAKKYMAVNGITGNLRDHLNRFQLQKLDEVEQLEKALLQMNYTYDEVKTIILSKKITGSGEVRALKEG